MKKINFKMACRGLIPKVLVFMMGVGAVVGTSLLFAENFRDGQANIFGTDIVISQVYGGGGNSGSVYKNDYIELFNPSNTSINITNWTVQYASSTGTSWSKTTLSGTMDPGKYYLIKQSAGSLGTTELPTPDATGTLNMSAIAGKVALVKNTTTLSGTCPSSTNIADFVGYGSPTNCSETSPTANLSNTTAALRLENGFKDTDNNNADFVIGEPNPRNSAHSGAIVEPADPYIVSNSPIDGATSVSSTANLSVTFSEVVTVSTNWYGLTCASSGVHSANVTSSDNITYVIDPINNFVENESCTWTIDRTKVMDVDSNLLVSDLLVNFTVGSSSDVGICTGDFTPIYQIQGTGTTAALTGSQTTQGIVVGDYEGSSPNLGGFYIQDKNGDGNVNTSDGIFVDNGSNDTVSLGELVRVSGTVSEVNSQTQISAGTITKCGVTGIINPTDVTLPFASSTDAERFEGMLIRFPQTLYVTEHYKLGRWGEVLMSSGDRLKQPTNVVNPGSEANSLQASNNLNRIIIDDAHQSQNPDPIVFGRNGFSLSASNTLRGGDTAVGIIGVMTHTINGTYSDSIDYRVRPINALNGYVYFEATNARPVIAADLGGTLKVANMNLLNFFNTFGTRNCKGGVGGTVMDCRGAENETEFERQYNKILAALLKTDADVVALNEIENDGYDSSSALAFLVDLLNNATAPGTYAFINADAGTGQTNALGTDAIKVAMIYKPAKVTPIGQTAALNTVAFVNGGDSSPRNRPALLQAFKQNSNNAEFIVAVNHLKSKGSACDTPDAGDGQGNCNVVRTNAAYELMNWIATNPTGTGSNNVLLIGDYNAYAKEDPISVMKNTGYTNLLETLVGQNAYSYVFDGQWGYLDHAVASSALLTQVTGVLDYHINADEPMVLDYNTNYKSTNQIESLYAPDEYRSSDHDVIIVGLNLAGTTSTGITVNASFTSNNVSCGADNSTLNVSFNSSSTGSHSAVIDWGDGNLQTLNSVTSPFSVNHTYANAGAYNVTVTINDGLGGSGFTNTSIVVNYNTSGILQIRADGLSVFKIKTTVPFVASFSDCNGAVPSNLAPTVNLSAAGSNKSAVNETVSNATVDTTGVMRFNSSTQQYEYNQGTNSLSNNSKNNLTVTVPVTGQTISAVFGVRR